MECGSLNTFAYVQRVDDWRPLFFSGRTESLFNSGGKWAGRSRVQPCDGDVTRDGSANFGIFTIHLKSLDD